MHRTGGEALPHRRQSAGIRLRVLSLNPSRQMTFDKWAAEVHVPMSKKGQVEKVKRAAQAAEVPSIDDQKSLKKRKQQKIVETESEKTQKGLTLDTGWKGGELPAIEDFFGTLPKQCEPSIPKKSKAGPATEPKVLTKPPAGAGDAGTSRKKSVGDDAANPDAPAPPKAKRDRATPPARDSNPADDGRAERTIFVGSVRLHSTARRDLRRLFSACGAVESVRLRSIPTENPKLPKKACIALGARARRARPRARRARPGRQSRRGRAWLSLR